MRSWAISHSVTRRESKRSAASGYHESQFATRAPPIDKPPHYLLPLLSTNFQSMNRLRFNLVASALGTACVVAMAASSGALADSDAVSPTGLPAQPNTGQTLVWEFLLDVEQRNAGHPKAKAITSNGTGAGRIEYDTTTKSLRYQFSWSGLSGAVTNIELRGPATQNSSTDQRLTVFARSGFSDASTKAEGYWEGEHTLRPMREAGFEPLPLRSILAVLASSGAYVAVQTERDKDAEIRGNLGSASSR